MNLAKQEMVEEILSRSIGCVREVSDYRRVGARILYRQRHLFCVSSGILSLPLLKLTFHARRKLSSRVVILYCQSEKVEVTRSKRSGTTSCHDRVHRLLHVFLPLLAKVNVALLGTEINSPRSQSTSVPGRFKLDAQAFDAFEMHGFGVEDEEITLAAEGRFAEIES